MKKIEKTSELMWLFGTVFVALGVAICSKTGLGVSMIAAPAFVIQEAIFPLWSDFSVGMIEYLFQGILLITMCSIIRKFHWSYLLAFLVAVIYGYTLNFFLWVLKSVIFESVLLRWVMLIVGDVTTAFGVACFFKTYLPLQVYELFVAEVARAFRFTIPKTKWAFDLSLLVISVGLAFTLFSDVKTIAWSQIYATSFHNIGLGTLVTTLINSPIIAGFSKLLDRFFLPTAICPKLESLLKKD